MDIDLEAIRARNNHVLQSAEYALSEDVHFTGQYSEIVLTNSEEQLFDPPHNKKLMLQERNNTLQNHYKDILARFHQYRDDHGMSSICSQPSVHSDKRKLLALFRDRIAYHYFNHVESLNMDDSSVICSLCQQFVFVRQFYKHVDNEHHDYFYKLEAMNRQLFRNAPPIELNFPQQSEFDIETHTIGQIDHLTIYYSRAEHISINSLLIHDIRPSESRRRLCLIHRMNELLENINEKEQTRKIQAQAKEDKKLLTQENKKRRKKGQPILLELPNNDRQLIRTFYHHRGRSGLINLTPVQALALKNRDYLHNNKQYQPKIKSLIDIPSRGSSQSSYNHNQKGAGQFKLVSYLEEHNNFIETVIRPNDASRLSYDLSKRNEHRIELEQARKQAKELRRSQKDKIRKRKYFERDFDYDCDAEYELNGFVSKNDIEEAFVRTINRKELEPLSAFGHEAEEYDIESENYYKKPVEHSPAVELVSSCSHVQNRHLRRPKCDFIPKRLYKSKSNEPIFGYDCWSPVKNQALQRTYFAISAIEKYFPRFRANDMFMSCLFDNLKQYSNKSITFSLKMTVLETIAQRKYFLSFDLLKDYLKVGYLRKIFKKLNRSEAKYLKYSKNGQRFQEYHCSPQKLISSNKAKETEVDSSILNQFFDDNPYFNDSDTFNGRLPFEIIDAEPYQVHFNVDTQSNQETTEDLNESVRNPEIFKIENDNLLDLKDDRFASPELSTDFVETLLKNLTTLFYKESPKSLGEYPRSYRDLASLAFREKDFEDCNVNFLSLEKALDSYFGSNDDQSQSQISKQSSAISLSEVSQDSEIDDISDILISNDDFFHSHSAYIDKILKLFHIETDDSNSNKKNQVKDNGSKALLLKNDGNTARLISPSYNNNVSNVKMAKSNVLSSCKKVYIVKNCNQLSGILPLSSGQIKPGTVLLVPQSSTKPAQNTGITRKLNKTDYDIPLGKVFKGPDRPDSSISLHKYYTRSTDVSRKRPLCDPTPSSSSSSSPPASSSASASLSSVSAALSMPSGSIITEMSVKKPKTMVDCVQESTSFLAQHHSLNSDSHSVNSGATFNYNLDKSPLREISQGSNRQNTSLSSSLQDSMDSKEDFDATILVNKDANSKVYFS